MVDYRREHSRKPDATHARIEKLFGDVSRLELFAREERSGWDVWGNQVGKFNE
jgi:N6-adenosine-specific RNA methylase IME4